MSDLTLVVFRKYPQGDVIALFPEVNEGRGMCSSYMHVGQHGGASYVGVVANTKPAKPEEYAALKAELEAPPYCYTFRVVKRWVRK